MKRSQNYGVDYGRDPIGKWLLPLLIVGALVSSGILYGVYRIAVAVLT